MQQQVGLLHRARREQRIHPRLRDDAAPLLELFEALRVVVGVARVGDRLAAKLRAEADAWQRVQRVEEGDRAALEAHRLCNLDGEEEKEAREVLGGHAGDEGVLAHERCHDGARGDDGYAVLEQDLLEGARIVVGVTVRQDDVRHLARSDPPLPQILCRVGRWVDQDPTPTHPKHEPRRRAVSREAIGRAEDGDAEIGRRKVHVGRLVALRDDVRWVVHCRRTPVVNGAHEVIIDKDVRR
mmetsp:Transcript_53101/g.139593  ORF Transcript_53101/g.139593 Transcript_53101/m.139593 type:complete len:240 (-) Transcript_53101:27-746(-)